MEDLAAVPGEPFEPALDTDASPSEVPSDADFVGFVRSWAPVLIGALIISVVVRMFLLQSYVIPSDSMSPTLVDGDRVVVNRLSYDLGEIERGQVVVFTRPPRLPGKDDVIKRVVGLPGETVRLINDQVYIGEERVIEPYLLQPNSTGRNRVIPGCAQDDPASYLCVVPEGHVFVMGDNRRGSQDSRFFGPIEIDSIVGRAFVRVWPITHPGLI